MRIRDILLEAYDREVLIRKYGNDLLKPVQYDHDLKKKVKDLDDKKKLNIILNMIEKKDPTCDKEFMEWLVNNYLNNKVKSFDNQIREDLAAFIKLRPVLKKYGKSSDINKYDVHTLYNLIDSMREVLYKFSQQKFEQRLEMLRPNEYSLLYKGPKGIIVSPKTVNAAQILSRGTDWPTRNTSEVKEMMMKGPIYILKDNSDDELYLIHPETFLLVNDFKIPLKPKKNKELLDKFPIIDRAIRKELRKLRKKLNPNDPIHIDSFLKHYQSNLGEYIRLLKDFDLANEPEFFNDIVKNPVLSARYAGSVLGRRWPEAEPHIMKDPKAAVIYKEVVLNYDKQFGRNKRWRAAEPYIMKDPDAAYAYAKDVFYGKRWPEAEPIIMKSPKAAAQYALLFLGAKRWPEAEPYIMKDPEAIDYYVRHVLKKRWPEAEPFLFNHPDFNPYKNEYFRIFIPKEMKKEVIRKYQHRKHPKDNSHENS